MSIGARQPNEYLAEVAESHPGVLESQWIPNDPSLWSIDRYLDFLEVRRGLMAAAINDFLERLLEEDAAGELPAVSPELYTAAPAFGEEDDELQRIVALVGKFGSLRPMSSSRSWIRSRGRSKR